MDMDVDLGLEMKISYRKLRLLLLYELHLGRKAMEATSNICGSMSKDVFFVHMAQYCFHRFKNGNYELDDLPYTGRPLQMAIDFLRKIIEEDPTLTTRRLAERLECSHIAVDTHPHELDRTCKCRVWISQCFTCGIGLIPVWNYRLLIATSNSSTNLLLMVRSGCRAITTRADAGRWALIKQV